MSLVIGALLHDTARGRGAPLEPAAREQMSGALGDSFADVRVHHDALASTLAQSVQARAFTTGADIFFARSAPCRRTGWPRRSTRAPTSSPSAPCR